jgi:integrase/recombinase XerD
MNGFKLIIPKTEKIISEVVQQDNIKILTFLNQPSFSKSTKESYTRILREFFIFFRNYGLKEITDIHVTLYLKSLDKKPATKNLILKAISSLYSYLVKTCYIDHNPVAAIKPEKIAEVFRSKILDFEQIVRMIDLEKSERNKLLLKILYYSGLRISEALSLTPKSFRDSADGGAYMTVIGKGTKVRTVYIPIDIYELVQKYIKDDDLFDDHFIFHSEKKDKPITRMQAFRVIKIAAKIAKVDPVPSPHWFRHSSATHAIENGAPIHVVQHSLGHASINTTSKYLHASPVDSNANYLKRKII